jgi:hypothetical protein
MSLWSAFNQWLYPRELRIEVSTADGVAAMVAASLAELAARQGTGARAFDAGAAAKAATPAAAAGLEKSFVLELCNNFHRLSRSAKPFQETNSAEAGRMNRNLDQLKKVLHDNGIECVDLTGQAYDPGRADFEPLGEPQATPGLTRKTIIQCERPLVLLHGKLLQPAKGIVGRPASE